MKPILARTYSPTYTSYPCYIQPKLNGVRALYQNGCFQSRDEQIWHPEVLQHLHDQLNTLHSELGGLILDGELYVHSWKLQRINAAIAVNRHKPTKDTPFIQYHIFDCVDVGKDFESRFGPISELIDKALLPNIRLVPSSQIWFEDQLKTLFTEYIDHGFEGVMLRPPGPYEPGKRSKYLWKYKEWEIGDFICVGIQQGEGKANIGIGALRLSTNFENPDQGDAIQFNVGTGFSDDLRRELWANPPIGRTIRIRYAPCLTDNGIPTHASFLAIL